MAGDWIKMRADLQTHPKVVRILSALCTDRLRVIGGLHAVWSLFDAHSVDGSLVGYTPESLDLMIGFPGFTAAMESVDWIEVGANSLCLPRFDEHNGQSAKRRASETRRKQSVRKMSAPDADKKRTREEKRREEEKKEKTSSSPKKSSKELVEGFAIDDKIREFARRYGQDADAIHAEWLDHFRGTGYRTKTGPVADAAATFRTFVRNAQKFARQSKPLFGQRIHANPPRDEA